MHELPVTEDILRIVLTHAQKADAGRVTAIHLVIGEMAGFIDESIRFYFDILSSDTIAAGAKLQFQTIPTRFRCRSCGGEFQPESMDWRCPQCQSLAGEVVAGKEFYVESIEVEGRA